ncbi:MAG: insulinase family protein [Nitrospirae bacterium]|nr:insulinase family protein [Nitrospirota bacterium]
MLNYQLAPRILHFAFYTLHFAFFAFSLVCAPGWAEALQVEEHALPNGLKVLLLEDHKAPTVTAQIWYRVGARHEIPGKTGLAHLLEHMMLKGTPAVGKGEHSRIVARNGGNENAFTGMDYTAYFQNFASDRVDLSLRLESDRMVNLLLDSQEFDLEREVVKEERRMRTEDDPTSLVVEELYAAAFKVHPYRNPVLGWMTDLEGLTREDAHRFYKTYYVPNNATLVVVGDFDPKTLLPKIRDYFGAIPRGTNPPQPKVMEPPQRGERRVKVEAEAQLPFVFAGWHIPNSGHPDEYALEVLAHILTTGKSSRLYRALVYDQQLAAYAGGDYDGMKIDPSLFYLYGGLRPGITPEAFEQALYRVVAEIQERGVTPEELLRAKNQVAAGFIMAQDSAFYRGRILGQIETLGVGWRYLTTYVERIRAVTAEDVLRVARMYLTDSNRTVGILIPLLPKSKAPARPKGAAS